MYDIEWVHSLSLPIDSGLYVSLYFIRCALLFTLFDITTVNLYFFLIPGPQNKTGYMSLVFVQFFPGGILKIAVFCFFLTAI